MTKTQLLVSINELKRKIDQKEKALQELGDELDTLNVFSDKCDDRIRAFEKSMSKRAQRLLRFESFVQTVKSAKKYKEEMNTLLNGSARQATVSSIDDLQTSICVQKKKITQDIADTKRAISSFQAKLRQLQYEYNHFLEEASADG